MHNLSAEMLYFLAFLGGSIGGFAVGIIFAAWLLQRTRRPPSRY